MGEEKRTTHLHSTTPDKIKLNPIQAQRLGKLANVPAQELENRNIAQIEEQLKWKIDPELLLFRRVCGQVVRWDPRTGQYQPVPLATVHVMDTDCDFIGYFPEALPWVWFYPIHCYQEEITSVVTDECGRFCVWIPRFDIDWVVRWRLERYCFPEILKTPNLGQFLEKAGVIPFPGPGPDPGPLTLDRLSSIVGRERASQLLLTQRTATIGGNNAGLTELLSQPAFHIPVPPPMSSALAELKHNHKERGSAHLKEFVRGNLERRYNLDLNRYAGPFLRWDCEWIIERELVPIVEVPDITFWVTQDTDGDSDQETIYRDGYFHVGWKSGPLSDITLHAGANAVILPNCQAPTVGDCGEPAILFAGLMSLEQANYVDADGFCLHPNPPHADGLIRSSVFPPALNQDTPANAPFMGTLQLYGCKDYPGGVYYRLRYSYNGHPVQSFTNLGWNLHSLPGTSLTMVSSDADGWYPIALPPLPAPETWFPPDQLLDWPTTSYADGLYSVTLEIGDAGKNVIFTSPAVPFRIDNSNPAPMILSLAWRVAGTTTWNYFPSLICPVVYRNAGEDLEFRVEYVASRPHMLYVLAYASGCGGGVTIENEVANNWSDPPSPSSPYQHWHVNAADNTVGRAAIFRLPHDALQGCYGFTVNSYSRSFNPAGGDASNGEAHNWYVDAASLIWNQANLSVSVVNT